MGFIADNLGQSFIEGLARHIHWLTVNPEEHRQAGELGLILPWPPSANHLWKPVIRRRADGSAYASLAKTDEYNGWWYEAGYQPTAGRWCRFREKKGKQAWGLLMVAVGLHYGRDAGNLAKSAEDLVCDMVGLDDRYNRTPATFRLDLTRALRKEGLCEGLYVLVEELRDE